MPNRVAVTSKDVAAKFVRMALRRQVMVSSARQAVSGLLSGGSVAAQYLGKKMAKAWKSRAGMFYKIR
jgi:mitochondrial translocator assembly and maintenance protein 41